MPLRARRDRFGDVVAVANEREMITRRAVLSGAIVQRRVLCPDVYSYLSGLRRD